MCAENMINPIQVLCVGSTGNIGRHVVDEALRAGHRVRALVRNPSTAPQWPSQVEVVVGDLTRLESLAAVVGGINAVVFTHGTYGSDQRAAEAVDYGAVHNVLAALEGQMVRVALMTAIAVTDRRGVHDWKRRAERLVRASGLPYTIVRPGWFDYNAPGQHRLVLLQGDRRQSGTPRDGVVEGKQIADVLVRSLSSPAAVRKTFELIAERGPAPDDFDRLFAMADPDEVRSLDGAHDAANMPLEEEPRHIVEALNEARARSSASGRSP
jgi:uncharacterized protein YbjT (DUF2867 family)